MKKTMNVLILLILVSCGGGGGGPGKESTSETNAAYTEDVIECFDDALGWIDQPPQSHLEALSKINSSDLSECGGIEEMRIYIKSVTNNLSEYDSEEELK